MREDFKFTEGEKVYLKYSLRGPFEIIAYVNNFNGSNENGYYVCDMYGNENYFPPDVNGEVFYFDEDELIDESEYYVYEFRRRRIERDDTVKYNKEENIKWFDINRKIPNEDEVILIYDPNHNFGYRLVKFNCGILVDVNSCSLVKDLSKIEHWARLNKPKN